MINQANIEGRWQENKNIKSFYYGSKVNLCKFCYVFLPLDEWKVWEKNNKSNIFFPLFFAYLCVVHSFI